MGSITISFTDILLEPSLLYMILEVEVCHCSVSQLRVFWILFHHQTCCMNENMMMLLDRAASGRE